MKTYKIDTFIPQSIGSSERYATRFGGQPDWIAAPQWLVSLPWDSRPLKFIGQIRLNDFNSELKDLILAYIFMTQPEDKTDPFFDPDIIYPDGGENAIIIQPDGKIPEYIHTENFFVGPTVDRETIWIPQTTESEEMVTTEFKQFDVDKFCGIPAFFQNSIVGPDDILLLQLHTNWLPFYINGGGEPTMFAFLNGKKDGGFILIEDM